MIRKSDIYPLVLLLLLSGIAWQRHAYPVMTVEVTSGSMLPNIFVNDRLICLKRTSTMMFRRGDVVVIDDPEKRGQLLVKRLIGLPGETVRINNNHVYINKTALHESYLAEKRMNYSAAAIRVPKSHIYVLGDNRNNSADSVDWGTLHFRHVKGKVIFRYWPFNRIGRGGFKQN